MERMRLAWLSKAAILRHVSFLAFPFAQPASHDESIPAAAAAGLRTLTCLCTAVATSLRSLFRMGWGDLQVMIPHQHMEPEGDLGRSQRTTMLSLLPLLEPAAARASE